MSWLTYLVLPVLPVKVNSETLSLFLAFQPYHLNPAKVSMC